MLLKQHTVISKHLKMTTSIHDTEKLVHGLITSRLDYCSALMSGVCKIPTNPSEFV